MRFDVLSDADWEASERYIRVELFSRASTSVYDSLLALIGYDPEKESYRMWIFARSQSEPMYLSGSFVDESLVLVGEPAPMPWGTQRMRYTFAPCGEEGYEFLGEYWTLDGWRRYCTSRMQRCE